MNTLGRAAGFYLKHYQMMQDILYEKNSETLEKINISSKDELYRNLSKILLLASCQVGEFLFELSLELKKLFEPIENLPFKFRASLVQSDIDEYKKNKAPNEMTSAEMAYRWYFQVNIIPQENKDKNYLSLFFSFDNNLSNSYGYQDYAGFGCHFDSVSPEKQKFDSIAQYFSEIGLKYNRPTGWSNDNQQIVLYERELGKELMEKENIYDIDKNELMEECLKALRKIAKREVIEEIIKIYYA